MPDVMSRGLERWHKGNLMPFRFFEKKRRSRGAAFSAGFRAELPHVIVYPKKKDFKPLQKWLSAFLIFFPKTKGQEGTQFLHGEVGRGQTSLCRCVKLQNPKKTKLALSPS